MLPSARLRTPSPRAVPVAVVLALLVLGGAVALFAVQRVDRSDSLLRRALQVMPADAVSRGLYFTAEGQTFASVYGIAPGAVSDDVTLAYGIHAEDVTAVLESGGPSVTVVLGDFPAGEVAQRFQSLGYEPVQAPGWTVLQQASDPQGPLAAAVTRVAVRPDAVVLGSAADVDAVLDGSVAWSIDWVRHLVEGIPAASSSAALGPSYDEMVAGRGSPPPQGGAVHTGWLLAFSGTAADRTGRVALAYGADAGPPDAGRLAAAVGADPVIGQPGSGVALQPGDPAWDDRRGVAAVDVDATGPDAGWAQLRRLLEDGQARFLRRTGP